MYVHPLVRQVALGLDVRRVRRVRPKKTLSMGFVVSLGKKVGESAQVGGRERFTHAFQGKKCSCKNTSQR